MKSKILVLLLLLFSFCSMKAYATLSFMDIFNKDKAAKSSMKNKCSVCHINPSGGGSRNDFGEAFDAAGLKITDSIRQQFPNLFVAQSTEPKITRVKPTSIFAAKEVKLMILGKNFASDSTVKLDGTDAESGSVTFVNPKKINLVVTFSESGVHTVQVVNTSGEASNTFKVKVKVAK